MNYQRKYFGTDGIRGKVGEGYITPEFVMRLGWAAGRVLAQGGNGPVLIGKDTRVSGYMFESALEAGLSAAGVDIRLLGPIPTPGIAFLTRSTRAQAGIVISASHNPYYDNGIKFFSGDGAKLPDDLEIAIEQEIDNSIQIVNAGKLGKARRITDASRRYIEFCKSKINHSIKLDGLKLVIDCANGAAYQIAPCVFEELGASVVGLGTEPDGFNINQNSGATNPEFLQKKVIDEKADVGIALDGDGDRLILVDHEGTIVDGDEILYIIASAKHEILNGAIVGTSMSNLGLELAVNKIGLELLRAQVGDRYVMEMLLANNLMLGGESSGHIINRDLTTTGDGIISALQVLETMVECGKTLKDLKAGMDKLPQVLINIKLSKPVDITGIKEIDTAVRDAESELGNSGRVLLRPSGTEPLIRVMVEGQEAKQIDNVARHLATIVETAIQATS